ncbi:MAG TPA: ParB/RepB/Spo0J family partition protein [Candidatus Avacidaminococcus intestinavium]|uniref:ParB/RepB/Spo0J family partition protein n=1 Tax=Candidatus Avacidaminococcus intestinavium TaxID=2840684 RepID=A0A9D1MP72_9FIRM|nr:ParB/RepB/Spo0J family partition protein [Candidatus Avacidaminococcus intestinavium]
MENEPLAMKDTEKTEEISVNSLKPNPYQPRKVFDSEKMKELVASIKEHGVIQPLIVRKNDNNYEIVAGERRWRAAKQAGLKNVPVVLRDYDEASMMEIAMIENIQRHNLNPLEEATGIKNMMEKLKLTQAETAKKLGRSRTAVTNLLRIMNLPEKVREYLAKEELTLGQVRPLLGIENEADQLLLAETIFVQGWSVRKVEEAVNALKSGAKLSEIINDGQEKQQPVIKEPSKKARVNEPQEVIFYKAYQEKMMGVLGTKVKIHKKTDTSGRIEIEYYSLDDLERIYEVIEKNKLVEQAKNSAKNKLTV